MCIDDSYPIETFVDGGYTYYNPAIFAISEAQAIWPVGEKFYLVSLGQDKPTSGTNTGKSVYDMALFYDVVLPLISNSEPPAKPSKGFDVQKLLETFKGLFDVQKLLETFEISSMKPNYVHHRMLIKSATPDDGLVYHRFGVGGHVHDIGLREWENLEEMEKTISSYFTDHDSRKRKDDCVQDLIHPGSAQGTYIYRRLN